MKGFRDIIGHGQIIEHLQNSIVNQKISHAYIFSGEDGSGKNMLAAAFAKALQCENGSGDACGQCRSCRMFEKASHPDVHYITHEKPGTIGAEEIREQVSRDVSVKPYSSRYKIYLIDEAEKMTEQAQNALLKTIEEPPAYAVLLLLTNNIQALLPTVRSRCITLELREVDKAKITAFLTDTCHVPLHEAQICAAYSHGNVGKAMEMALSEDFSEKNDFVLNLLKRVDEMDVYEMILDISYMAKRREDIVDFLDLMEVWYHDVLILKATNDADLIVHKDEFRFLTRKSVKSSYEGLGIIIDALEKAKNRLRANVNLETTLELLLLTMKEN